MLEQTNKVTEDSGDTEEDIGLEGADKLRRLYVFFANRAHQQGGDAIRLVELWIEHRHILGHIDSNKSPIESKGDGPTH